MYIECMLGDHWSACFLWEVLIGYYIYVFVQVFLGGSICRGDGVVVTQDSELDVSKHFNTFSCPVQT